MLVEKDLAEEDCGSDLASVVRLLKAVQGLEEQLDGHRDQIKVWPPSLCCWFSLSSLSSV